MTYVTIRVLSALGLAPSLNLPKLTPAIWLPSMSRPKGQASHDQHELAEATR
jgi:hypothetical protein